MLVVLLGDVHGVLELHTCDVWGSPQRRLYDLLGSIRGNYCPHLQVRIVKPSRSRRQAGLLSDLLFDPENVGDIFLRNVRL
jgi:hypothetical protein